MLILEVWSTQYRNSYHCMRVRALCLKCRTNKKEGFIGVFREALEKGLTLQCNSCQKIRSEMRKQLEPQASSFIIRGIAKRLFLRHARKCQALGIPLEIERDDELEFEAEPGGEQEEAKPKRRYNWKRFIPDAYELFEAAMKEYREKGRPPKRKVGRPKKNPDPLPAPPRPIALDFLTPHTHKSMKSSDGFYHQRIDYEARHQG